MITKKQRRSSRSYRERQSLAASHHARTPQIYSKDFKTRPSALINLFNKLFGGHHRGGER